MCNILEQYGDKINDTFSFFDRMLINGYLNPLMNKHSRARTLFQLDVPYKDHKSHFSNITESSKICIENSAAELGCPVIYLASAKKRKEDIAKSFLDEDRSEDGLIYAIKSLETYRSAKVYGSDERKLVVKTFTKCLHYYLYYQYKEFGFMFVKI